MISKYKILVLCASIVLLSCKKEKVVLVQPQTFYREQVIKPDDIETITHEEAVTFHKDTKYQYEYRTGISGKYEYNYDVTGLDQNGNTVFGNINTSGKKGAGILTNTNGQQIIIFTEWISYGKLKAVDEQNFVYQLEIK
jgi:hypothetical protein